MYKQSKPDDNTMAHPMRYILILMLLLSAGCVTHRVSLDDGDSEIYIELSKPMQTAQVELNGESVFDGKNVQVIRLRDLESGEYTISIKAQGDNRDGEIDYTDTIILDGNRHEMEIESPGRTAASLYIVGLTAIGSLALSMILF